MNELTREEIFESLKNGVSFSEILAYEYGLSDKNDGLHRKTIRSDNFYTLFKKLGIIPNPFEYPRKRDKEGRFL